MRTGYLVGAVRAISSRTAMHGALLAALSSVLLTAWPAEAQTVFTNKITGSNGLPQCLAVQGGNISNGSPLIIWDCVNDPSQTFYSASDGTLRIGAPNGQYCVAAFDTVVRGTRIGAYQCVPGHPSQHLSYGTYQDLFFVGSNPAVCLGVKNASRDRGSPIIGWDCTHAGNDNEAWVASRGGVVPPPPIAQTPVNQTPASINGMSVFLLNGKGAKCLNVYRRGTGFGNTIIIDSCVGMKHELFEFMNNGELRDWAGTSGCLDVRSDGYIINKQCGTSSVTWKLNAQGQIHARTAQGRDLCLDVQGEGALTGSWAIGLGSQAILAPCSGGITQRWLPGMMFQAQHGEFVGLGRMDSGSVGKHAEVMIKGQIVAAGGGNLVAAGGGNIVAAGGGNLVAAGGGNLVSPAVIKGIRDVSGNIVAAGGGNLVAAGGGNIVSTNGGNIIAAGGGNIVAAGGGN
jgi:Ricin-type beta-trefoil lectin domain